MAKKEKGKKKGKESDEKEKEIEYPLIYLFAFESSGMRANAREIFLSSP